jgi:hypothetical protein
VAHPGHDGMLTHGGSALKADRILGLLVVLLAIKRGVGRWPAASPLEAMFRSYQYGVARSGDTAGTSARATSNDALH